MSNARAAVHAYRAQADREWSALLRKFGYLASADYVERRAERHDRNAAAEARNETPPSDESDGGATASHFQP